MAIRTTDELVQGIIEVDSNIPLDPFMTAANALINTIAEDSGHTEEGLTLIETWLSAHFYAMRDPRFVQEAAGDVQATYQSKVDLNLATSHYGQMAMVLDTSGLLRQLNNGPGKVRTISVTWAGVEEHRGNVEPE